MARDVAVADCGYGGDDEIERRQVLLRCWAINVVVARDPRGLVKVLKFSKEEPQTGESVTEHRENEEQREQLISLYIH